jgi:uncharacterized lipoprotein YajG
MINKRTLIYLFLVIALLFVAGCANTATGAASTSFNPSFVGGGCGV